MATRSMRPRRAGFTIVELLVAMALIVLIMSILSQAFVEGLNTFRSLKGIGDMQDNLRTAVVPLRNDLILRHFEGDQTLSTGFGTTVVYPAAPGTTTTTGPGGIGMTQQILLVPTTVNIRPPRGFFRIQQASPSIWEG